MNNPAHPKTVSLRDVSVVIPTWNRKAELLACLESLRSQTGITYETLVVDDGSNDGTREAVGARFPEVRVLGDSRRLGPEARRNEGILAARTGAVLFLDSDVIFQESELIRRTYMRLMADAGLGEVGGEYPLHDREHANGHRFSRSLYPYRARLHRDACTDLAVDYLPSCFLMCRREVLIRVGGFDPYFLFGPTDADLGLRIGRLGLRNVVAPDTAIWHNASERGRRPDQEWCYSLGRVRILIKHHGVCRTALQAAWDIGMLARMLLKRMRGLSLTDVQASGLKLIPRAYAWHARHLFHTLSTRKRNFLNDNEVRAFTEWQEARRRARPRGEILRD